jgi:hypothetical protein
MRSAHSASPDDMPELSECLLMGHARPGDFELFEAVLAAMWAWVRAGNSLGTALSDRGQSSPLSFRRIELGR